MRASDSARIEGGNGVAVRISGQRSGDVGLACGFLGSVGGWEESGGEPLSLFRLAGSFGREGVFALTFPGDATVLPRLPLAAPRPLDAFELSRPADQAPMGFRALGSTIL